MIDFFRISMILIFVFIFITGFHDEGNLIATIVASRSLNVFLVFILAFFSQFLGTLFLGTKVAESMVSGILNLGCVQRSPGGVSAMICASVLGATVWNLLTWVGKIPSSSSHAIVGGLLGPFVLRFGFSVINADGIIFKVFLPLFTSPIIGYGFGYLIFKLNQVCFLGKSIRVKKLFQAVQIATCILINAFQGSNDAQKGMGIAALLLMTTMGGNSLRIPKNIVFLSAFLIAFGLVMGGMKMIKSVGTRIFSVRSLHSVSAQIASMLVVAAASLSGFPVSGTQIVNSSILGVGAADRPNAVGWIYAKNMLVAWFVTIPASFLLSAGFYLVFRGL
ncbi:MAG: inorganic phosphate transporter [Oscillospiraceae bacterium]|jgi:PiT family inorganic phosphate transporter|nr:inorganic phosphate transporter [Oscillospiraceae bacterium]